MGGARDGMNFLDNAQTAMACAFCGAPVSAGETHTCEGKEQAEAQNCPADGKE